MAAYTIMDWMKDMFDEEEIAYMEQDMFNQNVDCQVKEMEQFEIGREEVIK